MDSEQRVNGIQQNDLYNMTYTKLLNASHLVHQHWYGNDYVQDNLVTL